MNIKEKEKLGQILTKDWEFSYERRMGFHMMYLFAFGITDEFKKIFGIGMEGSVFRVVNGGVGQFYSRSGILKVQKAIKSKLEKDRFFVRRIKKLIELRFEKYVLYSKELICDYGSKSNKSLLLSIKKHKKIEESISVPSWILFTFFEEVLTEVLRQKVGSDVVEALSIQTEITPLEQYMIDVSKKGIDFVERKYNFLGMFDFFFEKKDRAYHEENYRTNKDNKKIITEVRKKYLLNKKKVSSIRAQFIKEKDLLDLYIVYSNLKEWKNFWREQLAFKYSFLMGEISKRYSVSLEDLSLYTYDELEHMLMSRNFVHTDEIEKRKKDSLFVFYKNKISVINDPSLLRIFDSVGKRQEESVLKGVPAFTGIVKGCVKIVLSNKDFYKVNTNDILVTSTTRPDFLPVMQKSAGFITNEGGLLSHAAIVAREFRRPCIIGTKIATKVLKDGDLVEVNANTGVVTILKRN